MKRWRAFWRRFRESSPTARWRRFNLPPAPPPERHPIRSVAARRCYDEDVVSGDYEYVPAAERVALGHESHPEHARRERTELRILELLRRGQHLAIALNGLQRAAAIIIDATSQEHDPRPHVLD